MVSLVGGMILVLRCRGIHIELIVLDGCFLVRCHCPTVHHELIRPSVLQHPQFGFNCLNRRVFPSIYSTTAG